MDKISKLEKRLGELQNAFEQNEQEIASLEEKEKELKKENVEKLKSGEPVSEGNPFLMKRERKKVFLEEVEIAIKDVRKELIKAKIAKLEKEGVAEQKILEKMNSGIEELREKLRMAEQSYGERGYLDLILTEKQNLENQLRELEPEKKEEPKPFIPIELDIGKPFRETKERMKQIVDEKSIGEIGEIEDKLGKRWGFKPKKAETVQPKN